MTEYPVSWSRGWRSLPAFAFHLARPRHVLSLLLLFLAIFANPIAAQESTRSPELTLDAGRPLPPRYERVLLPIPDQFNWLNREVTPNSLLETLLDLREGPHPFMLSGTVIEQYSDNFFQTEHNTEAEYRTRASIGTVYRLQGPQRFLSLANTFNASYNVRSEASDIGFVNLAVGAGYQLPRLSLGLNESFVRDDDSELASSSGIRRGRRTFLRNRVSPQLRYALTRLTSVALRYANTFVENEGAGPGGDSMMHEVTTDIQHRFNRLWTGELHYTFVHDAEDGTADTQAHNAAIDIDRRLDRHTRVALNAFGSVIDRIGAGQDSRTYGASINLRRRLAALLEALVSAGVTAFDRDGHDPAFYANWQIRAEGTLPFSRQTRLSLTGRQWVHDTAGDVDSVGVVLSRSVTLSLDHRAARFWFASLFAGFNRTEFLEDSIGTREAGLVADRNDNFWRAGGRVSYALTRTLSLAFEYLYRQRESNVPDSDFDENRLTLSVSGHVSVL